MISGPRVISPTFAAAIFQEDPRFVECDDVFGLSSRQLLLIHVSAVGLAICDVYGFQAMYLGLAPCLFLQIVVYEIGRASCRERV